MMTLSNTRYDWRIDIIRKHAKIGEAKFKSCTVDYVEDADVCLTMKAEIPTDGFTINTAFIQQGEDYIYFDGSRRFDGTWCFTSINGKWIETSNAFDMFSDRLRPVIKINDEEYQFADFMVIAAPLSDDGKEQYYSVEAYDETMMLKQSGLTERKYFSAGTQYLSVINTLCIDCGLSRLRGDNTNASITVPHEYAVGTPALEIINDLLDEINYSHIHAGTDGYMLLTKNATKIVADYNYNEQNSTIVDQIETDTDIYSLPNVVIGYTSSPDTGTVLQYSRTNSDPASAISTTRRGYNVVVAYQFDDCPNLATLTEAVNYKFMEATQATEKATVITMPDGSHFYGTYIGLGQKGENTLFREVGWSIEFGGKMTHNLERKAFV